MSELEHQFNHLALRRRILLHPFNEELRESIKDLFANWMLENPSIHHVQLGMVQEEPDEEGGYWSSITFHVCTDDEDVKERTQKMFEEHVLMKHMDMIVDALSEPIEVGVGHNHD